MTRCGGATRSPSAWGRAPRAPWRSPRCRMRGGFRSDAIAAMAEEQHGPGALTRGGARSPVAARFPPTFPLSVAGDLPEWLAPSYEKAFGPRAAEEGAALAERAPVDLRVNTLKATRPQVLEALSRFGAVEGPWSPLAVRIPATGPDTRNANVEVEPAHGLGWYEVQDAGSQVAALLSGAEPGMQRRRYLCRCRRQDAGARGADEERGQARRPRPRPLPPPPHLRAADARGRHQLRGDLRPGQGQARRRRPLRLRGDRRAMLRLRLLAEKARRQVAADAKAVRPAPEGPGASP